MEKRMKDLMAAMGGEPEKKSKRYVDDEEYEKITGIKPPMDEEESPEDEAKEYGQKPGRLMSIMISIGKGKK